MTALGGRRARRSGTPAPAGHAGRWLASALVGLVLLAWAGTMYVLVLGADGLNMENSHVDWWAHLIAVVAIVATVVPMRRWLRPAVDDVVFGYHDDAWTVMTEFNHRIDTTVSAGVTGTDASLAARRSRGP